MTIFPFTATLDVHPIGKLVNNLAIAHRLVELTRILISSSTLVSISRELLGTFEGVN